MGRINLIKEEKELIKKICLTFNAQHIIIDGQRYKAYKK